MAAAVLVLQAFTTQRGAPGCGTEQETARALVGGGPDLIPHALEAEHRVVDIERQHGQAMHAVAGGGCRPAGQCTGLRYTFFEDLAVECLAVTQHRADVLGRVFLPHAGIDADLPEQVGHAEGTCLVGHDGNNTRA